MIQPIFATLFVLLFYLIGIAGAAHALLKAREPRSALIWVTICLFLPLLGTLCYTLFGINRMKKVTQRWHSYGFSQILRAGHHRWAPNIVKLPAEYESLLYSGNAFLKTAICTGCKISPLFDAEEAYPAMIKAIRDAKESIFLVSYIFSSSALGHEFVEALADAVARKVEVKVLIDGVGVLYTWPLTYRQLKKRGIPVRLFLSPFHSLRGFLFLNMRNHAKILVMDGKLGFTGGMNITAKALHDVHFQCEGSIVGTLQEVFLNLWYFAHLEKETPRFLFYDDSVKGNAIVRGIDSGAYCDFPSIAYRLLAAMGTAKKHIRIMTPYFVVGQIMASALMLARFRGVEVEIILPEKNNLSFVKGATEALLPSLIKQGVQFYYRQGAFAHTKIAIVDDCFVCLGSSNLDTRSFLLNFEFNLEVYDEVLAHSLIQHFESIKQNSRFITAKSLQAQSFVIKFRNALCKLFSPYL